mmetsp:Transcript_23578/g.23236  ORF Transcript_23578/g.23236 Transcript_23578/m.23236 type:complete len:272 (-) Transcript_23578:2645-3460(-)
MKSQLVALLSPIYWIQLNSCSHLLLSSSSSVDDVHFLLHLRDLLLSTHQGLGVDARAVNVLAALPHPLAGLRADALVVSILMRWSRLLNHVQADRTTGGLTAFIFSLVPGEGVRIRVLICHGRVLLPVPFCLERPAAAKPVPRSLHCVIAAMRVLDAFEGVGINGEVAFLVLHLEAVLIAIGVLVLTGLLVLIVLFLLDHVLLLLFPGLGLILRVDELQGDFHLALAPTPVVLDPMDLAALLLDAVLVVGTGRMLLVLVRVELLLCDVVRP